MDSNKEKYIKTAEVKRGKESSSKNCKNKIKDRN